MALLTNKAVLYCKEFSNYVAACIPLPATHTHTHKKHADSQRQQEI